MKGLYVSLSALLVIWGLNAKADMAPQKEVVVGISGAYVPSGFDSTSDTYVVVNGVFQNGCYRWKRADITSPSTFQHEVRSVASVSQGMCLTVLVPFQKEVRLGRMPSGQHTIRFVNGDGTYLDKTMVVE